MLWMLMASFLLLSAAQNVVEAVGAATSCYNTSTAPDYLCPPNLASVRLAHETSCTRYYICENGKATEMSCAGTPRRYFNPITQSCGRSPKPCQSNLRVLIRAVSDCRADCSRVFVPYPSSGNASGVLVCNEDGSAYLSSCPITCSGLQTAFINGKCRLRILLRGWHKWEQLLRSPGQYPPRSDFFTRSARTRTGIRPLQTSDEFGA